MRNNILNYLAITALAIMAISCGTAKKATNTLPSAGDSGETTTTATVDPLQTVISTLGDWKTMQTGGNIKLSAGSSFSSSVQVRMVRDEAIFISLRPMLGIEVGKLLITADSLYAVDKVHKRYIAEKVSILTSGIPVTVSDVQDIFLGRPFIIGKGTLNESLMPEVAIVRQGNKIGLSPIEGYKGYNYTFMLDSNSRILTLDIVPTGSTKAAYQVKYDDVRATKAGNIAHDVSVDATVNKKKVAFKLSYKDIDWNGKVKIDRSQPNGYKRMSAADLFSLFSN
ncbi:MAG: DUF4292 domain-containing protein [Muribaculaceae bacterium]|nr:DUF4292 domain-containing protein [Muribaculaceae bacterium]